MKNLITIIIAFISFTTFAQIYSNAPSKFDKVQITKLDTLNLSLTFEDLITLVDNSQYPLISYDENSFVIDIGGEETTVLKGSENTVIIDGDQQMTFENFSTALQLEPDFSFNIITSDDNGLLSKIPSNDFMENIPFVLKEVGNNSIAIKKYDDLYNNNNINYGGFSVNLGIYHADTLNIGNYSFSAGLNSQASGEYSTAMGRDTKALGEYSTAMGRDTQASVYYSTAIGRGTKALGEYSTAMGLNSTASGDYSTAMGYDTEASGRASTAMGYDTSANEYASLAIGRYTTEGNIETSWVNGSPIFKVGNGVNGINRNNAYVLYNNGKSKQEGDFEITTKEKGIILKSQDGTRFKITVENDGSLTTTQL